MRPSIGQRLALCLILCGPLPSRADEASRTQIADIAGSERLRLFAYGKLLETRTAPRVAVVRMKQDMIRQGFYFDPGTSPLIARDAWIAPVLSYDGNINGGVLQDSFVFNGQVFDAAPDFRAKAGVVAGLAAGGAVRLAWANGRYVEARVQGQAVWSPEYQIGRSNAELGLCSRNHLTGWTFLDLCRTVSAISRELGSSTSQATELSLSQLFAAGGGYHDLTADLSQSHYDIGEQPALTLSWNAVWDRAATNLSLTVAAPINDETALRQRVEAGVKWLWRGRSVGVDLWHQEADGGTFLLTPRADTATGIGLSYEIRPGVTTQIGYMVNRSTVDFFQYDQLSVNIRFDSLRW
ncbi:MAG: hypothetical protein ACOH2H_25630 [Cypionkella sp.]